MLAILAILAALRSVRNLIAVPTVVFVDKLTYVFYFPTRYKLVSFANKISYRLYYFQKNIL